MARRAKFSDEARERAVCLVLDHVGDDETKWAAIVSVATKTGCSAETLRNWVAQRGRDPGKKPGLSTAENDRLKEVEREVRELRRANDPFVRHRLFLPRRSSTADHR